MTQSHSRFTHCHRVNLLWDCVILHLSFCILGIPAQGEAAVETHLELLVELAAVSVQHGQVQRPKVCVEAADTKDIEYTVSQTPAG